MAALLPPPTKPLPRRSRAPLGSQVLAYLRTTDHKQIGKLYLVTTFGFFMAAGAMAMLMRAELARPGLQFLDTEQYNQLFTMHGTIMLLLYATPTVFAFANLIMPCRSARQTWPSRGSMPSPTGCSCSAASWCSQGS